MRSSCRGSSTAVATSTAVAAPRWFVEPADHFTPPVDVRIEPRFDPAVLGELRSLGQPVTAVAPCDAGLGHWHAIELVGGGPGGGGSVGAAPDPRSGGLTGARRRGGGPLRRRLA